MNKTIFVFLFIFLTLVSNINLSTSAVYYNKNEIKNLVECMEDSDCGEGYFCDVYSGDFRTWKCVKKECENGESKCVGNEYFTCVNYRWENNGVVIGKCGVKCIDDCDCSPFLPLFKDCLITLTSEECVNSTTLKIEHLIYRCKYYRCVEESEEKYIECEYGCGSNSCLSKDYKKGKELIYALIMVASFIVGCAILIFFIKKSRKRK